MKNRPILAVFVLVGASAAVSLFACGETTTTPPSQLNFDRPIDMAFACYGGLRLTGGGSADPLQDITTTAQPLRSCELRSAPRATSDPTPVPPGQEPIMDAPPLPGASWYAFILQSGPGTVAIAQFPTKPSSAFAGGDVLVLDADPLTPGKNGISVGEDPIAITTDKVGCYEVIANAGSCDLSALDISSALDTEADVRVSRVAVNNAAGVEILARPAAMVGEPPGGVIGAACPAQPTGIVYMAYPACHLVAAVDAATGTIVAGVQFDALGIPTLTNGAVSCPNECGGGGTFTSGVRPVALDLEEDPRTNTRRLLIGADNSPSLTLVELDSASMPVSARQIALEDTMVAVTGEPMGVTSVAIAPQIGMGGNDGTVNDDLSTVQLQFVYAIATDDSIRVAELIDENECDTNVDPRLIDSLTNVRDLSCFPVGVTTTPARRTNARGPGIRIPGPSFDAVPTSIEVFKIDGIENDPRLPGPTKFVGYFGVVTATSGSTYILNVDDDDYGDFKAPTAPLQIQLPLAIAHSIRDAVPSRDLRALTEVDGMPKSICDTNGPDPDAQGGNAGGVRVTANPTRNVPSGTIAPEKVPELPQIRSVLCTGEDTTQPVSELAFAAPDAVRDLAYQDLISLRDETWTMTFEGSLSLDKTDTDIDGPPVRSSMIVVDGGGMRIIDQSQPFCDAGVEQFDVVQLRGCDPSVGDAECPLGYTCFVHPNSQVPGIGACMLADEADRLADACKDFLTSSRRYTVGRAAGGELRLEPRRRMLATTPLDGCIDDDQCEALADYASDLASAAHPSQDASPPNGRVYACAADPTRRPLTGPMQTGKRCFETCTQTSDCTVGAICAGGFCTEGVIPPQACVNAPQRYELRAGDAFALVGTQSGYVHSNIRDAATNLCRRDPMAHPFEIGRVPLNPPACDPTADPRTGRRVDGTFEPNPCATMIDHTEQVPSYVPGTCTLADPTSMVATRQAPAIRVRARGAMFHVVDPYYPGDNQCIRDRGGMLGKVPLAFPGYQVSWRQTAGLTPLTLPIRPAYPVKVLRGPTQSIWVIDEGDFLSTSITEPSTRGKVFRIEGQAPTLINLLE